MKSRKPNSYALVLLLLAGASGGCTVREQVRQSVRQELGILRLRTDSLALGRREANSGTSVQLAECVRLSPPDSSGRQHVTAVERTHTVRRLRSVRQDSLLQTRVQTVGSHVQKLTETVVQKEKKRSSGRFRLLLFGLALTVGVLWIGKGFRRQAGKG